MRYGTMDIPQIQKHIADTNATIGRYDISVSQVLENIRAPFDADKKARDMYMKHYNNPHHKYYRMKPEEILAQWDRAAERGRSLGKSMDDYTEIYFSESFNNRQKEIAFRTWEIDNGYDTDKELQSCVLGFRQFIHNSVLPIHLTFVGREIDLFYKTPKGTTIKGRCDGLFMDDRGQLLLVDYKTNKELLMDDPKVSDMMRPPFQEHKSMDYNAYTLQLYFYTAALAYTYNICSPENIKQCIVHLYREPDILRGYNSYILQPSEKIPFDIVSLNRAIDDAFEKKQLQKELLNFSYGK